MKAFRACAAVGVLVVALAGCQGEMHTVATLENAPSAEPLAQMTTVTEKGSYYLYSSKHPDKAVYQIDLKKGDQFGFRVRGNEAQAVAKGIIVELSEYSEGATYQWKREEKAAD